MQLVTLDELKKTTTNAGQFDLGAIARCRDDIYGVITAIYVYSVDALTDTGGPAYIVPDNWPTNFQVDEDEDDSDVKGQELCAGAFLSSAAVTTAFYGWVQVAGMNPIALTTDGDCQAGEILTPTSTDGTWTSKTHTEMASTEVTRCGVVTTADNSTTLAAGDAILQTPVFNCATLG